MKVTQLQVDRLLAEWFEHIPEEWDNFDDDLRKVHTYGAYKKLKREGQQEDKEALS